MGNYNPRKATFTVVSGNGASKVLTPRNQRAHHVMRRLGKRTKVTLAQLRAAKGLGSYQLCVVDASGRLMPVR